LAAKFAHMDPTRFPHKFLTAWVSHPRCSGGQHYTLRNSYVETLQHILPNIPDNGTIDSWLPLAQNHEQWKTLGTEWIKHRQALTIYQVKTFRSDWLTYLERNLIMQVMSATVRRCVDACFDDRRSSSRAA
jgi:hypothetical protein